MAPNHGDMLADSTRINRKIAGEKMPAVGVGRTLPEPPSASEISHEDPNADPFGGNMNNKRVAERIAGETQRRYANNSHPFHMGDPRKAAADVARSNAVNPTDDEKKTVVLPTVAQSPDPGADMTAEQALAAKQAGKKPAKAGATPAAPWSAEANK
jgi:hypothetical protein